MIGDDDAPVEASIDGDPGAHVGESVLADDDRLPRQAGQLLERGAVASRGAGRARAARANPCRHLEHAGRVGAAHAHRARLAREQTAEPVRGPRVIPAPASTRARCRARPLQPLPARPTSTTAPKQAALASGAHTKGLSGRDWRSRPQEDDGARDHQS